MRDPYRSEQKKKVMEIVGKKIYKRESKKSRVLFMHLLNKDLLRPSSWSQIWGNKQGIKTGKKFLACLELVLSEG